MHPQITTKKPDAADAGPHRALIVSAAWTLAVWGSRATRIEPGTGWEDWARTAVSLGLAGALLIVSIHWSRLGRSRTRVMLSYSAWMVAVWFTSLAGVIDQTRTPGFRVVHALLAILSLLTAAWVTEVARKTAFYPTEIYVASTADEDVDPHRSE